MWGNVALIRRGVVSRELIFVPLARLQSVRISQGPVQRRLGLARAHLHTVAGPVSATVSNMDQGEAVRLFDLVARRAVSSANLDTNAERTPPR